MWRREARQTRNPITIIPLSASKSKFSIASASHLSALPHPRHTASSRPCSVKHTANCVGVLRAPGREDKAAGGLVGWLPGSDRQTHTMDQYEKLEKIGEGTYGKVYKARDKNTGKLVALKKTRLEMEEEGVPSTALREVSLLQMLSESNHVVKLLCVEHVQEGNKPVLYLVFEYLTTDLKKFMDSTGKGPKSAPMPIMQIKSFMYQLIKGVAHCHKHGVMHRDLKPQNLLVDTEKECLKIADLGLGRQFSIPIRSYTHEIVTLWYRAPEVLLGCTHYAPAVDMWSCSAIFAEMVQKQALLPGDCELQQLLHTFQLLGTPNEQTWPGVTKLKDWHEFPQWAGVPLATKFPNLEPAGVDLMQQMFVYDPAKRITAKDALVHPYFDDLDKATIDLLESETVRLREGMPPY